VKYFGVLFAGLVATAFAFRTASQTTTGVSVQGKVLNDGDGQPIRNVSVQLSSRDNSANQYSATTDVDGQFKVDNVKVGRYLITVEHPGFVHSGSSKQSSLLLQTGQSTADAVIHMNRAGIITGKIVDLDGDPMSNVGVSAQRVGNEFRGPRMHDSGSAITNDLGEFRIADLRAGRYTVTANPPQGPPVSPSGRRQHAERKSNLYHYLLSRHSR